MNSFLQNVFLSLLTKVQLCYLARLDQLVFVAVTENESEHRQLCKPINEDGKPQLIFVLICLMTYEECFPEIPTLTTDDHFH